MTQQSSLQQSSDNKPLKRTKERFVGEAMDLVERWRSLFTNKNKENNQSTKYSLEQAAQLVGVSRKTLEDYYYTLRKVRQFKLADLEELRPQKMGIVRQLIKNHKKQSPKILKIRKINNKNKVNVKVEEEILEKGEESETIELKLVPTSDQLWEQNYLAYQNQIISMDAVEFIRNDIISYDSDRFIY